MKLLSLILYVIPQVCCYLNIELVRYFFATNYLKFGIILYCQEDADILSLLRSMQRDSISLNAFNIRNGTEGFNFEKIFFHSNNPIGVAVDLQCLKVPDVFDDMSGRTFFHMNYVWLMFSGVLSNAGRLLDKQNINCDAEITLAVEDLADSYHLYEVYNPSSVRRGRLRIMYKMYWNKFRNSEKISQTQSKIDRRRDFGGITFKAIITIIKLPNTETVQQHLEGFTYANVDNLSRINYKLFQLIQEIHNFKIFLYITKSYGLNINGTYDGAIGALAQKKVDLSLSGLRMAKERYGLYDYTTFTYVARVLFIFRHPRSVVSGNIFLEPFVVTVWICVLILGIFVAYLLKQIFVFENKKLTNAHSTNDSKFSNALLIIFGFIFQQGNSSNVLLTSGRIVTISALFFSVLLYQYYSSFIVGSLLTKAPKTIKTMKQLLASQIECGIDDVPYNTDIFNHATDETAIRLYQTKILARNNIMRVQRGIELIKKGGFAFHTDVSSTFLLLNNFLSDDEVCDLQEISYISPLPSAPSVPKLSPLKELVKIDLRRMHEYGLVQHHSFIFQGKKPKCAESNVEVTPVDWTHFSSAIYILLIGMLLSFIILAAEWGHYQYTTVRRRIKKQKLHFKVLNVNSYYK